MEHSLAEEHSGRPPVSGQRGTAQDAKVLFANPVHVIDRHPQAQFGADAGPALIPVAPCRWGVLEAGLGLLPVGIAFRRHLALPRGQPHPGGGRPRDDEDVRRCGSRRGWRGIDHGRHGWLSRLRCPESARCRRGARIPAGGNKQRQQDQRSGRSPGGFPFTSLRASPLVPPSDVESELVHRAPRRTHRERGRKPCAHLRISSAQLCVTAVLLIRSSS
jgi:hypothetical protein